eukprot:scaffold102061_cov57-Phaeocystis_antarctica.AAC.1
MALDIVAGRRAKTRFRNPGAAGCSVSLGHGLRRSKHGRRCRQGQLGQRAVRPGQPCCGEGRAPILVVESLGSRYSAEHGAGKE